MICRDGYSIEQNPGKNAIIISLPQTMDSLQSTATPISYTRKFELTSDELLTILKVVEGMFE